MDRRDTCGVTARTPIALTIAGSDSGGGAGVQADLKTFAALGVHGASAITALTAQNTMGVCAIHYAPAEIVAAQIEAVLSDFSVASIKIGMLGTAEIVGVVAGALRAGPSPQPLSREQERGDSLLPLAGEGGAKRRMRAFIVCDPVITASSGDALSRAGLVDAIKQELLPLVDCLTPNLAEAAALLGRPIAASEAEMADQGKALLGLGPGAVLIKGGHLAGEEAVDLLVAPNQTLRFAAPKIASGNLHGTGCVLSSAIAAHMALGLALSDAVAAAKTFVGKAIEASEDRRWGAGQGPLAPLALARTAPE
jgi:hydroxymethylpyrimidine/phosphomethylpyrimidine kinase